jgi:hypothetical protein
MRNILIALLIFLLPNLASAQGPRKDNGKLESRKIAFLTTKLDLTAAEAKTFWPIYNDYTREHSALRKERFQKMISFKKLKEIDDLTDAEIQTLILNDFDFKQRELNIEKKYYNKFKSGLPIKIVGKFYRAQESFKKEILNQFRGVNPPKQTD